MDSAVRGDAGGGKRRATVRGRSASLSGTSGRAAFERRHGARTGEGAR
ncbi:DUF6380 family protein [Streptomyces zinciresistens]